jgi:acetyl-CoA C-acetyltransferase
MGVCADLCAAEYNSSREDQDKYAIQSYELFESLGKQVIW